MKHKHHIVPRHMGGTDDPDNLVLLSIEEHAQAHLTLYEKYGKTEDLFAYKSLSNQMDEERQRARSILGGKKSSNAGLAKTEEHKKKIAKSNKGKHGYLSDYRTTEDQKRRSLLGNLKRWGRRDILSPTGPKIPCNIQKGKG